MRFVHQHADYISSADDRKYVAQVYAGERQDHSWEAWCVFFPKNGADFLVTDRETAQGSFDAVRYWASGLTHRYFEGALDRAQATPRDTLQRHDSDATTREEQRRAEAEAYALAADAARDRAHELQLLQRAMRRGIRVG